MSTISAVPVAGTPASVATTPAPKLNAIQIIEQELANFIRQREQAIANTHAVEGAIQGAQHLLAKLKAEAEKAEGEAKKILTVVKSEATKIYDDVAEKI